MKKLLLAMGLLAVLTLAGCGGDSNNSSSDSDPTSTAATSTGKAFVGELAGVEGLVAFDVTGSTVKAYVCDGKATADGGFALWFKGAAGDGVAGLTATKDGASLTFAVTGDAISGTVTFADGRTGTFTAGAKADGSGIYDVTIGVDGSYTGQSTTGDAIRATIGKAPDGYALVTGTVTPRGEPATAFTAKRSSLGEFAVDTFTAVALVVDGNKIAMAGRSGTVRQGDPGLDIISMGEPGIISPR